MCRLDENRRLDSVGVETVDLGADLRLSLRLVGRRGAPPTRPPLNRWSQWKATMRPPGWRNFGASASARSASADPSVAHRSVEHMTAPFVCSIITCRPGSRVRLNADHVAG